MTRSSDHLRNKSLLSKKASTMGSILRDNQHLMTKREADAKFRALIVKLFGFILVCVFIVSHIFRSGMIIYDKHSVTNPASQNSSCNVDSLNYLKDQVMQNHLCMGGIHCEGSSSSLVLSAKKFCSLCRTIHKLQLDWRLQGLIPSVPLQVVIGSATPMLTGLQVASLLSHCSGLHTLMLSPQSGVAEDGLKPSQEDSDHSRTRTDDVSNLLRTRETPFPAICVVSSEQLSGQAPLHSQDTLKPCMVLIVNSHAGANLCSSTPATKGSDYWKMLEGCLQASLQASWMPLAVPPSLTDLASLKHTVWLNFHSSVL